MIAFVYFTSFAVLCVAVALMTIGMVIAGAELLCRVAWPRRRR